MKRIHSAPALGVSPGPGAGGSRALFSEASVLSLTPEYVALSSITISGARETTRRNLILLRGEMFHLLNQIGF